MKIGFSAWGGQGDGWCGEEGYDGVDIGVEYVEVGGGVVVKTVEGKRIDSASVVISSKAGR